MTTKDEALRMALEALEELWGLGFRTIASKQQAAITAIREALAEQPAQQQEPFCYHDGRNIVGKEFADHSDVFPLYTSPPPRKPLTQCWKCGDMDAEFQAKCTVPACGMKEQPAQQQEPSEYVQKVIDALYENSDPVSVEAAELLEQMTQQQEPVAYVYEREVDGFGLRKDVKFLKPVEVGSDLYTSPPASKPLTDEQILSLVPGLQDCLCDPWDYNNSGDYYASIPKDMIRLARAIEAAHGIKGEA